MGSSCYGKIISFKKASHGIAFILINIEKTIFHTDNTMIEEDKSKKKPTQYFYFPQDIIFKCFYFRYTVETIKLRNKKTTYQLSYVYLMLL